MELGEQIRVKREKLGLTQAELAGRVGTIQQTVDRIERGLTGWSRYLSPILNELGLQDPTAPQPAERGRARETADEIPIYATREGEGDTIDVMPGYGGTFPRPGTLYNATGIYAVYMHGNKMSPRFRSGDLLVVNPHQPARAPASAVFLTAKKDKLIIGDLERETASEWVVKRYAPKQHEIVLRKKDYPFCETIHAVFSGR
jgi:transcriptional regulator with XRE-family HTH domain